MDDYTDNMDKTVTREKDVIDQLVVTNYKQDPIISTQATTILTLYDEVKQL